MEIIIDYFLVSSTMPLTMSDTTPILLVLDNPVDYNRLSTTERAFLEDFNDKLQQRCIELSPDYILNPQRFIRLSERLKSGEVTVRSLFERDIYVKIEEREINQPQDPEHMSLDYLEREAEPAFALVFNDLATKYLRGGPNPEKAICAAKYFLYGLCKWNYEIDTKKCIKLFLDNLENPGFNEGMRQWGGF